MRITKRDILAAARAFARREEFVGTNIRCIKAGVPLRWHIHLRTSRNEAGWAWRVAESRNGCVCFLNLDHAYAVQNIRPTPYPQQYVFLINEVCAVLGVEPMLECVLSGYVDGKPVYDGFQFVNGTAVPNDKTKLTLLTPLAYMAVRAGLGNIQERREPTQITLDA
jgi:hypothetical protein